MTDRPLRPSSMRPFSLRTALGLHLPWLLGVCLCLFAGWFELTRAREGHTIAWVYAFEWPAFGVTGTVIWWRLLTGREAQRPGAPGRGPARHRIPEDDPQLQAWREYRAGLERGGTGEQAAGRPGQPAAPDDAG